MSRKDREKLENLDVSVEHLWACLDTRTRNAGARSLKIEQRLEELERHMRNVQGQADTLGQRSHANRESIHMLDEEVLQLEELTRPKRKLGDRVRAAWQALWGA